MGCPWRSLPVKLSGSVLDMVGMAVPSWGRMGAKGCSLMI